MPIDLFSLAKTLLIGITDRLYHLNICNDTATRIKESLEDMQLTIKKIEQHVKDDSDTKAIKKFHTHLQNASKSFAAIEENYTILKFLKASSDKDRLEAIESEINMANNMLSNFIDANNLKIFCEYFDSQNEKFRKITVLQESTSQVGVNIVTDTSVRPPPPPTDFTVKENNNTFILTWKPSEGTVEDYEVCYDEQENYILPRVGKATTVEIKSPRVLPNKLYTMKVRGINKGGTGEWSDSVVVQLTKPLPQKPEISNLFPIRSTMAGISVKIPGTICSTESPITCIEASYISATDTKWSRHEIKVEPAAPVEGGMCNFTVKELQPDSKYNFRVRSKNNEGWSLPSDPKEGTTLALPPKPVKPKPPIIKPYTPTEVAIEAMVPLNTCSIKSPIIAWKVFGCGEDKEKIDKYHEVDESSFADELNNITLVDLNPNQNYTLQLYAKNENGWSEPSEKFEIHIVTPSKPKNFRISSNRTYSLIKVRWDAPDSILITHYEIIKRIKTGKYTTKLFQAPANKFSATFKKLKSNTSYCFKIRACNGFHASDWSKEIEANTRTHVAWKAPFTPFVWALGTAVAPLITPVATATLAGKYGNDSSGKTAAVAAGAAGAVGGVVGGVVGAPVFGMGATHAFLHGIDKLSDQSDDEDAVVIEN